MDEGEFRDEPSGEEVVQEYDEVEDLQRGERVPVRVQDPKLPTPQEVDEHNLTHLPYIDRGAVTASEEKEK